MIFFDKIRIKISGAGNWCGSPATRTTGRPPILLAKLFPDLIPRIQNSVSSYTNGIRSERTNNKF